MRVIYDDQTDTQPDDTSSETVKPQTRAEEAQPDVDESIVEIFDAEGTTVYRDTYANLQTQNGGDRRQDGALTAATNWRSVRETPPRNFLAEWDHPVHFAARDLRSKTRTPSSKIVCTLSNIKATLTCSKDLADQFTVETISTVSLGETSMVFIKVRRARPISPPSQSSTRSSSTDGSLRRNARNAPSVQQGDPQRQGRTVAQDHARNHLC